MENRAVMTESSELFVNPWVSCSPALRRLLLISRMIAPTFSHNIALSPGHLTSVWFVQSKFFRIFFILVRHNVHDVADIALQDLAYSQQNARGNTFILTEFRQCNR